MSKQQQNYTIKLDLNKDQIVHIDSINGKFYFDATQEQCTAILKQLEPFMKLARINERGRIQCGNIEFSSGNEVEVYIDGKWRQTRIEHNGSEYYSVDGFDLVGHQICLAR